VVFVAPVADGQPSTMSVAYDPPLMMLTWVLITAAGVLAVLGVTGLVRARRARGTLRTPVSGPPAQEPT
jgi:cytochrome c-type biogenesis protein CcmH/NrfF